MDLSWMTDQQLEQASKGDVSHLDDQALERLANGDHLDKPNYSQGFFKTYEGDPQGFAQKADVMAGKGANLITNALSAPFELAGEAIAAPIEQRKMIAPRLFGGQGAVDPFDETNKIIRSGAAGLTAPFRGQGMAQQAQAEYNRPENIVDKASNVALGVGTSILAPRIANAPMEAVTEGLNKTASILGKAGKFGGKILGDVVQKTAGIDSKNTQSLLNKPTSLFTAPTKADVSTAYSNTEIPQNIVKTTADIVDEGTSTYGKLIKRAGEILKSGENNPEAIVEGRKALDKQIAVLNNQIDLSKGSGRSALLQARNSKYALRDAFNEFLDKIAPNFRKADEVASKQLSVDSFRNVTLPGKINFLSPEGVMRGVPGLPMALGTGISGIGAAGKAITGATKMLGDAAEMATPISGAAEAVSSVPKVLTRKKAKQYLEDAGGNKNKARKMAENDGYIWEGKK